MSTSISSIHNSGGRVGPRKYGYERFPHHLVTSKPDKVGATLASVTQHSLRQSPRLSAAGSANLHSALQIPKLRLQPVRGRRWSNCLPLETALASDVNPITAIRGATGYSLEQLAVTSGLATSELAEMEAGQPNADKLARLTSTLGLASNLGERA